MTYDFFMGQLRLFAVGIIGYLAGSHRLTTDDAGMLTSILVPVGALLGPWLWSLYRNMGMRLVPADALVIAPHTPQDAAAPIGASVAGKVVGALLAGILLFGADAVHAADMMTPFRAFTVADIQAALDDATANNDKDAAACYSALLPVVQSAQSPLPTKPGIFLAFQKARDIVNTTNQVQAGIGPLADVKRACASVLIDTQTFLLRLGVLGGGAFLK